MILFTFSVQPATLRVVPVPSGSAVACSWCGAPAPVDFCGKTKEGFRGVCRTSGLSGTTIPISNEVGARGGTAEVDSPKYTLGVFHSIWLHSELEFLQRLSIPKKGKNSTIWDVRRRSFIAFTVCIVLETRRQYAPPSLCRDYHMRTSNTHKKQRGTSTEE